MTASVSPLADPDNLRREIDSFGPWFHNLHLPGEVQTAPDHPLGDFPGFKWRQIAGHLPEDLEGWTALDIGCNAGFYSFELALRGAEVTAIDVDPRYLRQARWAAARYGLTSRIDFRNMQVYDLARMEGSYDLVVFMGVLYHLRYPLLALDIVARKTKRLLVFQTLTMPGGGAFAGEQPTLANRQALVLPGWPKLAFIEDRMEGDPANWWIPNQACAEAMLRSCGMRILSRPAAETYVAEPDPDAAERMEWQAPEYLAATGLAAGGPDAAR